MGVFCGNNYKVKEQDGVIYNDDGDGGDDDKNDDDNGDDDGCGESSGGDDEGTRLDVNLRLILICRSYLISIISYHTDKEACVWHALSCLLVGGVPVALFLER